MYRRRFVSVLGLLSGIGGGSSAVAQPTASRSTPPSAGRTSTTHQFTGTGVTLTDPVRLEAGITTVDIQHDGDATIRIEIAPATKPELGRLLVDDQGAIDGGRALAVEAGEYVFAVTATGKWALNCNQPAVETLSPAPPPRTASGVGPDYIGPVLLGRTTELICRHHGEGSFGLQAYTPGESQQLLADSGSVDELISTEISGPTWFDVKADGEWTVEVS